jgi:hypothetical protein
MSRAVEAPLAPVALDVPLSSASSDTDYTKEGSYPTDKTGGGSTIYDSFAAGPLAPRAQEAGSAGQGLLVIFGLKKRDRVDDLDAVRQTFPLYFCILLNPSTDRNARKRL